MSTTKPVNQKAWFLILPVILCVAFSAILPLMTVVNYSVQDQEPGFLVDGFGCAHATNSSSL